MKLPPTHRPITGRLQLLVPFRLSPALLTLLAVVALALLPAALAATLTVSTTKDQLEDIFNTINDCSLREAIISVNEGKNMFGCAAVGTYGSNDIINVPAGTYKLERGIPGLFFARIQEGGNLNIFRPVTIIGAGAATTIIDGDQNPSEFCGGVLQVDDFDDNTRNLVTISDVTIRNGLAVSFGGANATCPHSGLLGQNAGGGIYNREALTLISVVVEKNTVEFDNDDGGGGGIFSDGRLELLDSVVRNNTSGTEGGGVFNYVGGELLIEQSVIEGNAAELTGVEYAGGVHNLGTATIRTSIIRNNRTSARGGGVVQGGGAGTMTILFSTISNNQAPNFAGGGILHSSDALLTIQNSTISGNQSGDSGGGIFAESGVLALSSVTLTDNETAGNGGGVRATASADVRVENSVLAGNRDTAGSRHPDCSGSFASFGFNLIGDVSGCSGFTRVSDRRGNAGSPLDPLLGPLTGNGGPTPTHLPLPGSPLIDAGGIVQPPPDLQLDQRGFDRPQDGDGNGNRRFDTGAVELAPTLEPSADLAIGLADDVDPVAATGVVTYTLQLRNDGPGIADSAVASAAVLGGTVINTGTCGFDGPRGVRCLLGDLFPGDVQTRQFVVIPDVGVSEITVTAEFLSSRPDADPSDNGAQETTQVAPPDAQLVLNLNESADPVEVGASYSYTMRIENPGSDSAGQVTLVGSLSSGARLGSLPSGCSEDSPTVVRCLINGLGAGESNARTIEVLAPATIGVVEFEVIASSPVADAVQARISTSIVAPDADLAIVKAGPSQVQVNQTFSYTLAVTNSDATTASGPILVSDDLVDGVFFVSAESSAFTCAAAGQQVRCSLAALEPGATATINLTVRAPGTPTTITNQAGVSSDTPDPNPANNVSDVVTTTVTAEPPPPAADLQVIKSAPASVAVGAPLRYQLTVLNAGVDAAENVTLRDDLPAGVSAVVAPDCTIDTPVNGAAATVSCELGTLAPGESVGRTIDVTAPTTPGTLTNTAAVSTTTPDSDPANNRDSVETLVLAELAPPTVVVTAGPNPPADAAVAAGSANVPAVQLTVRAAGEEVQLERLTVRAAGSGNDALDLRAIKLFHDANGDGRVDAGDTLLGSSAFAADDGTVALVPTAALRVADGDSAHLLVAVDVGTNLAGRLALPLSSLALLGFGVGVVVRRRRLRLLPALLLAAALFGGCATQVAPPPPPPPIDAVTFELTATELTARGQTSGLDALTDGLPLTGAELRVEAPVATLGQD